MEKKTNVVNRSFFGFIYGILRKLFGGKKFARRLRHFSLINNVYDFISSHAKERMVELDGYKLYLDTTDGIAPHPGDFEEATTVLFKKEIRRGNIVLDIGADVGYYTCLSANLVGRDGSVYAFEPNAKSYALLKKSVEENGFTNVTAVQKAVSDSFGSVSFFMHGPHSTLGYDRFSDGRASAVVDVIPLDEFLPKDIRVDFVKIDVEGSEVKALRGMEAIVKNNPKIKIVIEFYPKLLALSGDGPGALLDFFTRHGFVIYDINNASRMTPISSNELLATYPPNEGSITNLFCVRN